MFPEFYKSNYHPFIRFLFTSNMLSKEQRVQRPKRTQKYWNKNKEQQYDYSHWVKPYTEEFENIEKVHNRLNHVKKTCQNLNRWWF